MLRMKYVVGLAMLLATGLLAANVAVCDDQPGQPTTTTERWDDGTPIARGLFRQVAMLQDEDAVPPGPPPGRGQGRAAGAGRMQGQPGNNNARPGRGLGAGVGMGPGMNPSCPIGGMPGNDPEMFELFQKDGQFKRESHQLAAKYQAATPESREKIKKDLEELVNKQFDVRQQRRNLELKRLEEQIQRLRDAVSRRDKARKELVDKRVSELLERTKELDF